MEVDPVILLVKAEVDRYQAELRRATRTVDQQIGTQERRIKQLENQFRSSSSAISLSLKGLAGTLATAFTGQQLVGLIDGFTRLQNSLRVAGLEGENLAQVQERLLSLSGQYGVDIEELARLFGQTSQAASELGASQEQILQITEATSQALKITGTSAVQAQGALLGLVQAFAGGVVRAEEFNQINEGGLRPLLQAAANSERFGGSVNALRQEMLAGTVTSEEFFRSILDNSAELETKAANATLTLSGAVTALNSQLTVYVGSAASGSGATGALAAGIQALADNLDVLIPAAATIAAIMAGRFALGLATAAFNATALRVVALGLAVQLNGTAAAATLAGRALLGAFGGPIGIAIGAVAVGLTLVATRTSEADRAAQAYAKGQDTAAKATTAAREAAERLASAHGRTRAEALVAAKAEAELTKQKIASAKASLQQAQAELARLQFANRRDVAAASRSISGAGGGVDRLAVVANRDGRRLTAGEDRVQRERGNLDGLQKSLNDLTATINAASAPAVGAVGAPSGGSFGGGSGGGGGVGPFRDTAGIELRFRDELDSIRSRINAAEAQRATTAEERAEFERRQLELAEAVALRSVAADADLDDAQRAELRLRLLALGEAERDAIAFRERAEIERRNLELLDERGRAEIDALRLQFDLADTEKQRRTIALQILDAENDLLRSKLDGIIASDTATDIERERAKIARAALEAQEGAQRASVNRQFATPLERFAIDAKDADTRIQEAIVRRVQDINDTIATSFTDALGIRDPFLSQLISIFLEKNIFGPLAEALAGSGKGGGGLIGAIGSLIGGLFGRSSGGPVMAGRAYRVNEGAPAGRVEAFVPNTSGQIIPLGRMNAVAQGGGNGAGAVTVRLQLSGDLDARIEQIAGPVAIEVTRAAAPQIVDAAANETLRRANRPSL